MDDLARLDFAPQIPARLTVEEFQRFVDHSVLRGADKVELDEGVIVRMSPSHAPHMIQRRNIYNDLDEIFAGQKRGWDVFAELTLQLGPATLRALDVGVIRPFGVDRKYPDPATVLMAVEVSFSTLDYDLHRKARDYARNNIPNYWVVDAEHRIVHVMAEPAGEDYRSRRLIAFGEPIPVPDTDRTIVIA